VVTVALTQVSRVVRMQVVAVVVDVVVELMPRPDVEPLAREAVAERVPLEDVVVAWVALEVTLWVGPGGWSPVAVEVCGSPPVMSVAAADWVAAAPAGPRVTGGLPPPPGAPGRTRASAAASTATATQPHAQRGIRRPSPANVANADPPGLPTTSI
jgi:hypothetical protein